MILKDIRFAIRILSKRPGFAFVIILTLALAIGANTAIFSFVNAILLQPLPYDQPEQLVILETQRDTEKGQLSLRDVTDILEETAVFEDIAVYGSNSAYNISGDGQPPDELPATLCSSNLFEVLGVDLSLGTPWPQEFDRQRNHSIVLTHKLWQDRYQGQPEVLDQMVKLDGYDGYRIFGVLPPDIHFPFHATLFRSIAYYDLDETKRSNRWYEAVGRLRAGVTYEQANAELQVLSQRLASEFSDSNFELSFTTKPLEQIYRGEVRPYLWLLFGAVTLILLIGCVNVINLLLARAVTREKEFAIRAAVGSGRASLIRQLLIESCLLSLTGGILGLAAAYWWVDLLTNMIRTDLPNWITVEVDPWVLGFTFGIAMLIGLIAGVFPIWHSFKSNMGQVLKEGKSGSGGRHRKLLYNGLMVTEKVLAVVLLIGAGLMVKSFINMQQVEMGFKSTDLATFRVALGWKAYQGPERKAAYYKQALAELSELPEIEAITMTSNPPFGPHEQKSTFTVEGQTIYEQQKNPFINYKRIAPDYFEVMDIKLVEGRAFNEFDVQESTPVTIINEKLARKLWSDGSALGKKLKFQEPDSDWHYMTVVGVSGNVLHDHLTAEPGYDIYYPYFQTPLLSQYLIFKTQTSLSELRPKLNDVILGIDPEQCAYDFQTMDDRIESKIWQKKVTSSLFVAFGILAMLLAAIGIFSVMSYTISRRTKEMGIRRVFGASTKDVYMIVLEEIFKLTALSIVVGLGLAFFLTDFLDGILFNVATKDPYIFILVPIILNIVAFLAGIIPAFKASRVKPVVALKYE